MIDIGCWLEGRRLPGRHGQRHIQFSIFAVRDTDLFRIVRNGRAGVPEPAAERPGYEARRVRPESEAEFDDEDEEVAWSGDQARTAEDLRLRLRLRRRGRRERRESEAEFDDEDELHRKLSLASARARHYANTPLAVGTPFGRSIVPDTASTSLRGCVLP